MTESQHYIDAAGQPQEDRRSHHRAREIFAEACALLVPMLASGPAVSGFALGRAVHDRFGDLDAMEVDTLVNAIRRLHRAGQLPDA